MSEPKQAVVLVTGASSGLGNAVATFLAKKGMTVYGTSRDPAARTRRADEFFELVAMDAADGTSVERAVAGILEKEGRLDAVICNAGMGIAGPVEETPVEEAVRQLDVNFFGAVRVIRASLPALRRDGGRILVVDSMAGRTGIPFQAYYSASKYALEGLVESLRLELRPFPVQATLIEPGDFRTGFTSARRMLTAPGSPYASWAAAAIGQMEKDERAGASPILMARLALKLLGRKKLAVRYTVGMPIQRLFMVLKRFLPAALFELGFAAMYGLLGKPAEPVRARDRD